MEGDDSEFANFTLPTLKAFFEARSHNVSGNKQYLVARALGCPKTHFFYELAIFWSAKKRRKDTFFPPSIPLSSLIFATATVLTFVLLRDSRFNFHCYAQRSATPTQKSARKWRCDLSRLLARKITKGIHSCKPASLNHPTALRLRQEMPEALDNLQSVASATTLQSSTLDYDLGTDQRLFVDIVILPLLSQARTSVMK